MLRLAEGWREKFDGVHCVGIGGEAGWEQVRATQREIKTNKTKNVQTAAAWTTQRAAILTFPGGKMCPRLPC